MRLTLSTWNGRIAPPERALQFIGASLRKVSLALGLLLMTQTGCARIPPHTPQEAFREVSPPSLHDDLELAGLADAVQSQLDILRRTPDTVMQFGAEIRTRASYADSLERLLEHLRSSSSAKERFDYIRENFRFFEWFGDRQWGTVLLTSYFEPVIPGSRSPTPRFPRALFAKPPDLLTIPLTQFSDRFKQEKPLKGRLRESKVVPYYTREEIDGQSLLRGKGLELAWVDPIDGFFLQIQGSGTVRYSDGSEDHIVYADKNGHRYEAIGKYLKERLAPKQVTMQRIERELRAMSAAERDSILFRNPSYVFFNKSARRAITSLGVPATPGRTIATDPHFAPKGALAFLEFLKPDFGQNRSAEDQEPLLLPASRFVVDQDTGGAITGTGRVDLFWGRGDEAKRHAGVVQHPARIVYLVPR
jgi:membrane-bound lytic murein transglycosylase A